MTFNDPFSIPTSAIAVGTGRLTLDVILRADVPQVPPLCQAGGTCGNVLANLAYLGWQAYPLTDLGADDPGDRFTHDLARWSVHLDLIRRCPDQQTPVIVHHISNGGAEHRFSSRCPFCDHRLRYYEPVPLAAVEERLPQVPTGNVCFFDRDSEGALLLAREQRRLGAIVMYEPNYAGPESNLDAALEVAHILKYAEEKLPRLTERIAPKHRPWLVIETQGANGLRFLVQGEDWQHLPAWPMPIVRDAGGSGDWATAGFLHCVAQQGMVVMGAPRKNLCDALTFGQALAAWNCAFFGARGGVYHVSRQRFEADVRRILAGEYFDPSEQIGPSTHDPAGRFCPNCGG